ncbi:MAG: PGF-pre-PGF domain-containing protein [Methanoregula sp.]|nr:PGF-pre-PGF domain-containing protein [Methanoregula sp.]
MTPAVPTRTTDIYLKVNAEYLAEHKVTPADITIMSYGGSGWQPLPTSFVYSSGNNFYFKSDADRYSVLAIGNKKDGISGLPVFATDRILAEQPQIIASAVPAPGVHQAPAPQAVQQPAAGPVARETSAVPAPASPEPGFPFATAGLVAVGGVGLIGGGLLVRRWYIRRQNPALFREYD